MCPLYLQILEVYEEYFSHHPKDICRTVLARFDIREPRTENCIIDEFCRVV